MIRRGAEQELAEYRLSETIFRRPLYSTADGHAEKKQRRRNDRFQETLSGERPLRMTYGDRQLMAGLRRWRLRPKAVHGKIYSTDQCLLSGRIRKGSPRPGTAVQP